MAPGPSTMIAGPSSVVAGPSSMVPGPSSAIPGPSSMLIEPSFVVLRLSPVTSRLVCEDHRRGSGHRDGPDSKRNACAAVHSSKHRNLSLVASEQFHAVLTGRPHAEVAELWRSCSHTVNGARHSYATWRDRPALSVSHRSALASIEPPRPAERHGEPQGRERERADTRCQHAGESVSLRFAHPPGAGNLF